MATSTKLSPPPGSYTRTSRNVVFKENPKAHGAYILTADCQTVSGAWVSSTLEYGIQNCDGNLVWSPLNDVCGQSSGTPYPEVPAGIPAGSYLLTSRDVSLKDNNGNGKAPFTLNATAQKANGSWQKSSLDYDIANCDGKLKWNPKYGC